MKAKGMIRVNGKLQLEDIQKNEPDRKEMHAHGTPFTVNAAKGLIKNYWDAVKDGKYPADGNIAFTFGKESLLSILSQKHCEGVRFYLATKSDADLGDSTKPDNWENGLTLVAIGVDSDSNKEIGVDNNFIIENIDQINDDKPGDIVKGSVAETVPPSPPPKGLSLFQAYIKAGGK